MKKNVFTRPAAILLALLLILGTVLCPAMAAEADSSNEVIIKLHYNRPDGVYDDWSVWFWNLGQEGVDIPFAEENGVSTVATEAVWRSVSMSAAFPATAPLPSAVTMRSTRWLRSFSTSATSTRTMLATIRRSRVL